MLNSDSTTTKATLSRLVLWRDRPDGCYWRYERIDGELGSAPLSGNIESFEGKVFGTLTWPPRGDKGFGYDPIFVPTGYDKTFGEFDPEEKYAISHRAVAFKKLVSALG